MVQRRILLGVAILSSVGLATALPGVAYSIQQNTRPELSDTTTLASGRAAADPSGLLWAERDVLSGLDGVTADDVWSVGAHLLPQQNHEQTLAAHWDGAAWTRVGTPHFGPRSHLDDVAAVSGDDVWAVGSYESPHSDGGGSHLLVEHWAGASWQFVSMPEPQPTWFVHQFTAVTATAADDVWAFGEIYDNGLDTYRPLLEHWDGSSWRVAPRPPRMSYIDAISATSPTDVWAVGDHLRKRRVEVRIAHWDGSSWTVTNIVEPPGSAYDLDELTALAPDDVWAVGSDLGTPLALHWNGQSWARTAYPDVAIGLEDVSGSGGDDVWTVGADARAEHSVFVHWDGSAWTQVAAALPEHAFVTDVDAIAPDDAWAIARLDLRSSFLEHWDGTTWQRVDLP